MIYVEGGGGGQEFLQLVFSGGLWKISANVTEGFKGGIAKKLQQKPLLCFPPLSRELFVSLWDWGEKKRQHVRG